MRKVIIGLILCLSTLHLWGACTVIGVHVGGVPLYSDPTPPTITISGPGTGGATAVANMAYTSPYWYVSSVTVTAAGSFTGPASATVSGGYPAFPSDPVYAYVVMGGDCSVGGRSKRKYVWIM